MLRKDKAFAKCGLIGGENLFYKMHILLNLTNSDSASWKIKVFHGEGWADIYLCDYKESYKERALAL